MKLYLSSATFYNRAPFEKLALHFEENEIAVLTAANGRGKTTLLSHIVDAFHEMAKRFFRNEYEGKETKFYRLSSGLENLDLARPSLAYLRFKTINEEIVDYVNIRGALTENEYDALELPPNKTLFSQLKESLDQVGYAKSIFPNLDQKKAQTFFNSNLLTYFPSYRYEAPGYLNDPYQIRMNFASNSKFLGHLDNPIEVVSGLPQLINWVMDVVLDRANNPSDPKAALLLHSLNMILTNSLGAKGFSSLRFGIGPRNFGAARVQVVDHETGVSLYPSFFNISSGESSIFCLFGELIRQADNIVDEIVFNNISGIVLIDEVDKHLHIKLQKEVLPNLFQLFPNIQFIVSSHSPFLSMGLADVALDRTKIIDLDAFGISKDPTTNELYAEVYRMMIGENERFKELYHSLETKIKEGSLPLVITEGKTDVQHLRTAKNRLNIHSFEFEFFDINEDWGDNKLKSLLEQLSKVPQTRKIIGIFDRDVPNIIADIEKDGSKYKIYGNNVFAFCLPIPSECENYLNISIEFFYKDSDLKKEKDGRRLYFDNEIAFIQNAARKHERKLIKLDEVNSCDERSKKIFDENVGALTWIHSKAVFSDLVENDPDFTKDFDFSSFKLIFERLEEIIS
jgi:energy-coupling factor transporter ATP-binding protein EcfA2